MQGDSVFINYAIFNTGNITAGPSRSAMYLSTDRILDSLDHLLFTATEDYIPVDDFIFNGGFVNFPSSIPPGNYFIAVQTDYQNDVEELNEFNNITFTYDTVRVIAPIADLIIPQVVAYHDIFASPGDSIYFIYSTTSRGIAAQADVGFYLSVDSVWDTSDLILQNDEAVDFFMYNYNTFWDKPLHVPGFVSEGIYYLIVVADPENSIPESNELNNEGHIQVNVVKESFIVRVPSIGLRLVTTCTGILTDNEPTSRYKPGDGIVTLYPEESGTSIRLDFKEFFSLNYPDTLYIFDGPDTSYSLQGKYNYPGPVTVIATNTTGALTVRLDANNNYANSYGFLAYISCVDDGAGRFGIVSKAEDTGVIVYPNPTEGIFTISIDGKMENSGMPSVYVYDPSGKLVDENPEVISGLKSDIDLSQYPHGIYTVKVVSSTSVSIHQILVK